MRASLACLALGALLPFHPLPGQRTPASSATVTSEIRESESGREQLLYVTNRSDQTVIVTSVRLIECENVLGSCVNRRLNIRIVPGDQAIVLRVRPRFDDQPFSFRSSFAWTVDRGAEEASRPAPVPVPVDPPAPRPSPDEPAPPPAPIKMDSTVDPRVRAMVDEAVKADSAARSVVDTIVVTPGILTIRVGDTVPVQKALLVMARNAQGESIAGVRLRVRVEAGTESLRVDHGALIGLRAGSAVLLIEPPRPPDTSGGEPKGGNRVLVRVAP